MDYLWNAIRVQGGAYGAGINNFSNGNLFFYTFRDPNAAHSLDCFDKAVDFVKEFFMNGNGLDKLITGSISDSEPLSEPKGDMKMADTNYFCGVTFEDRCKARKEMLGTTKVDLLKLCDHLMAVLSRLKCGLSYASAATYSLYHTPLNVLSSLQLNPALLMVCYFTLRPHLFMIRFTPNNPKPPIYLL